MKSARAEQLAQHRAEMELAIAEGLSLADARYQLWLRRKDASERAQAEISDSPSPSLARTPRPEGGFYWERY